MKKAFAIGYLESLTGEDIIDLYELPGSDDEAMSGMLANSIDEISGGGSTVGKEMRSLKAHVADSKNRITHHMTNRLGSVCGKNAARDWWRCMKDGPAIETVQVPIKYTDVDDGIEKFKMEDWPFIDPHSIADFLFERAGLRIPSVNLQEYWQHHARFGEPWAVDVPFDCLPLGIYGDAARVHTKFGSTNMIGIWFNIPLWKPQSVRASRFLVAVVPEHETWHHFTIQVLLRRAVWSLNCLIDGAHPLAGPYNEPLPQHLQQVAGQAFRFKCRMTEIRGDWQWHKRTFRFKNCSWNAKEICYHCGALSQSDDGKDLYWVYEDNNWSSPFTTAEFLEKRIPERGVCPFIGIRHFHPSMIRWCMMHVVHLGLLFVCNGSAMNLLLRFGWFGGDESTTGMKLARVYKRFKEWTAEHKIECSQPPFSEKMIFKKNSDVLFTAKAYNGRIILEWLTHEVYAASTSEGAAEFDSRFHLIAAALRFMARFLGKCERAGRYLIKPTSFPWVRR